MGPQGLKPFVDWGSMYGLKPVPFTDEEPWAAGWDEGQLQIHIRLRSGQASVASLLWMTSVFA